MVIKGLLGEVRENVNTSPVKDNVEGTLQFGHNAVFVFKVPTWIGWL